MKHSYVKFSLREIAVLWFSFISLTVYAQTQLIIEAESGVLNGANVSSMREGFLGQGYVAGFNAAGDYLEVSFNVPASAQYKIEMIYASMSVNNSISTLLIDSQLFGEIRSAQSTLFIPVNAGTHQFSSGAHKLRLVYNNAMIEPDYFRLTPVQSVPPVALIEPTTRVEAEDGILLGTRVEFGTPGYSGHGYVTNFDTPNNDKLRLLVHSESTREYTLKIGFATPYGYKENYLSINGSPNQTIQFEPNNTFGEVTVGKVRLNQGMNTLEITHFWGWFELDYFEFSQVIGLAPHAVSQGNILLHDDMADQKETVTLDASASSDPDGQVVKYLWIKEDGAEIGMEPMFNYEFSTGTHLLKLIVRDNDGNTSQTEFSVIVADLENLTHHRLPIRKGQDSLFMSGMNIAWTTSSNFAKDLTNYHESSWITILNDIKQSGGNAIRWWLHTNGSASPSFGADGKVSGLHESTITNIRHVLDLALERGILVSLCLWSFDMLQNQGQNLSFTRAILEDSLSMQAYINRALIPMVEGLADHPAIMTWEIFNEPEGMTTDFGWSHERTTMSAVQQFVNRCAGAIHRASPETLVSNGSWSFRASTDLHGYTDYYRDDRLIEAGGDPDGTLDFIQVHYYDHFGIDGSPFHHPASYWGIEKPIVIGEFPANGIKGFSVEECYQYAYRLGYAGVMAWSYSDMQFGGLLAARPGMLSLFSDYPEDIVLPDSNATVAIQGMATFEQTDIFPNPVTDELKIKISDPDEWLVNYEIRNMQGQLITKGKANIYEITTVPLQMIPSGNYIIRLMGKNKFGVQRIIKI